MEVSPDPRDDPICAFVEFGKAEFIVTLNEEDFPQRKLPAKVITQENDSELGVPASGNQKSPTAGFQSFRMSPTIFPTISTSRSRDVSQW